MNIISINIHLRFSMSASFTRLIIGLGVLRYNALCALLCKILSFFLFMGSSSVVEIILG